MRPMSLIAEKTDAPSTTRMVEDIRNSTRLNPVSPHRIIDGALQEGIIAGMDLGRFGPKWTDQMLVTVTRPIEEAVNTVPGLTSHSLAPKAAARAGRDGCCCCLA